VTDDFPPVSNAYELRVTLRARADLGVGTDVAPDNIDEIIRSTTYRSLVKKFVELRGQNPNGTDAPMRNVGRPDIFSLHGRDGVRACTWFDSDSGVCWLLGCVDQHDYSVFESRALNGELLPGVDDLEILYATRNNFNQLVAGDLEVLVSRAATRPGHAVRGTVGGILRLEVSIVAIVVGTDNLVDLFITVRLPIFRQNSPRPEGWPGETLLEQLALLATGLSEHELTLSSPTHVPYQGTMRPLDPAREISIRIENLRILGAEGGD
jgi:hypothetical protein